MNPYFIDVNPYQVLEIPYSATDDEIRQAFQCKMQDSQNSESIIEAYGLIRDSIGRQRFRWDKIETCLNDLPSSKEISQEEILAFVKELAFLSPWEIGDDSCLT